MKIKTRSSAKKRVKITKNWKWKAIWGNACTRHLLLNKTRKAKNRNAQWLVVSKTDIKAVKRALVK